MYESLLDRLSATRMVAIDLDGTLLDDESRLTDRTAAVLDRAIEGGLRIVIATGRSLRDTRHLLGELSDRVTTIAFNGALIQEDSKLLHINPLLSDQVNDISRFFQNRRALPVFYDEHGGRYLIPPADPQDMTRALLETYRSSFEAIDDLSALDGARIMRISVWDTQERTAQLQGVFTAEFGDRYTTYLFEFTMWIFEVLHADSTKGCALRRLAMSSGVPLHRVAAIGNHLNDVSMMRVAGTGIAVENALPAVKDAADFVIAANTEEGVARLVEEILANRAGGS
ncbi:HAD family hydrolase [bacterium]|nr:HAD family hydrolase [candidate division CSSED10-310 bacterium]